MKDKEDHGVLKAVRVGAVVLPFALKLGWSYLKLKRKMNKRRKIFRRRLKKEGVDDWVIDALCEEMEDISLRKMLSSGDIPGMKDWKKYVP